MVAKETKLKIETNVRFGFEKKRREERAKKEEEEEAADDEAMETGFRCSQRPENLVFHWLLQENLLPEP